MINIARFLYDCFKLKRHVHQNVYETEAGQDQWKVINKQQTFVKAVCKQDLL